MKTKSLLFIISIVVAFSCSKESQINIFKGELLISQRNSLPDVFDVIQLLQQPVNGYVSITSFSTLASQDLRGEEIIIKGFCHNENGISSNFGDLSVSNQTISFDDSYKKYPSYLGDPLLKNLYGQEIPISLAGQSGLPGFDATYRVPPLITITSPQFENGMKLSVGDEINWISDSENTFGIGMLIDFDSNSLDNTAFSSQDSRRNPIHTEDDGSYVLTQDDLERIPQGAKITFLIGRANYERVEMDAANFHIGLVSYSVLANPFVIE